MLLLIGTGRNSHRTPGFLLLVPSQKMEEKQLRNCFFFDVI